MIGVLVKIFADGKELVSSFEAVDRRKLPERIAAILSGLLKKEVLDSLGVPIESIREIRIEVRVMRRS